MSRHRTRLSARAKIGAVATAVALAGGTALGVAGVAQAGGPAMVHDWNPQPWSPQSTDQAYWPARAGKSVTMFCWTGGPTKLGTGKWFKIRADAPGQPTGFVPANAVWPQVPTPHC